MPNIFDIKLVFTQIPALLEYLPVTLAITAISMIIGVILGFIIASIRIRKIVFLNQAVGVFVSFMRGTPLIVQLYLSYYGIPVLLKYYNYYNQTDYNVNDIPSILFVLLAFSLNEAAYNSESIRAAMLSVDKKQNRSRTIARHDANSGIASYHATQCVYCRVTHAWQHAD
nr:ABC transporter permease subunit [Pectobacterium colocasium]